MMQNHICNMELNRRYYSFDKLKVTEKKLRFSGGLTEYFPPNPQLVKIFKKVKTFRCKFILILINDYLMTIKVINRHREFFVNKKYLMFMLIICERLKAAVLVKRTHSSRE